MSVNRVSLTWIAPPYEARALASFWAFFQCWLATLQRSQRIGASAVPIDCWSSFSSLTTYSLRTSKSAGYIACMRSLGPPFTLAMRRVVARSTLSWTSRETLLSTEAMASNCRRRISQSVSWPAALPNCRSARFLSLSGSTPRSTAIGNDLAAHSRIPRSASFWTLQ